MDLGVAGLRGRCFSWSFFTSQHISEAQNAALKALVMYRRGQVMSLHLSPSPKFVLYVVAGKADCQSSHRQEVNVPRPHIISSF